MGPARHLRAGCRHRLAGERRRHQRAAVKRAGKGHYAATGGGVAGDLDGILNCLRAAVGKEGLRRSVDRHQRVQPFGERDIGRIGQHLEGGVGEALQLVLHSGDHPGMAVAGAAHGDAGDEIDIAIAVDVPDFGIARAGGIGRRCADDTVRHRSSPPDRETGIVGRKLRGMERCGRHQMPPRARYLISTKSSRP